MRVLRLVEERRARRRRAGVPRPARGLVPLRYWALWFADGGRRRRLLRDPDAGLARARGASWRRGAYAAESARVPALTRYRRSSARVSSGSPSAVTRYPPAPGRDATISRSSVPSNQAAALVVGGVARREAAGDELAVDAADAAPRRRSADRSFPGKQPSPSRSPSSSGQNESVTPASNQQLAPALTPPSTAPRSQASRSATSIPWRRQTASMFAVLPPPTHTDVLRRDDLAQVVGNAEQPHVRRLAVTS